MTTPSKVLLVDDDPIMRELAQAKLCEAGYQVILAENGRSAYELLKDEGADLVISDLEMPEMDGYALTEAIRADQEFSETPVIVITGTDRADAIEKAFAAGATSFIAKPMNWTLFGKAVMFVLRAADDQKALRAARDQAEAGVKFKDSLLSIMSHELMTPLNAIIGFGQLLSEQFEAIDDEAHKEYATFIVEGGRRLLATVSDMLLASDAGSGPIAIDTAPTSMNEVIAMAQSFIAEEADAAKAQVSVRMQEDDYMLDCDATLIARGLAKVMQNSIRYSPPEVAISVGVARMRDGGLAMLVKDNGPGMEAAALRDALTPFARVDVASRRTKEGLGLGLPLTQAILQAHHARFRIESAPGDGTRIIIKFPPAAVGAAPQKRATAA